MEKASEEGTFEVASEEEGSVVVGSDQEPVAYRRRVEGSEKFILIRRNEEIAAVLSVLTQGRG